MKTPKQPKTYALRTVADFAGIPEARRAACLEDFGMWLKLLDALDGLFSGIDGVEGKRDVFTWIDDGKHDMRVDAQILHRSSKAKKSESVVVGGAETPQ